MSTPATVRRRLWVLVLAFMLPTVIAAVLAIRYVYLQERLAFERTLVEATRAVALVVDRELARRESVLKAMAASSSLSEGDLARFHAYAQRLVGTTDTVVVLSDLQGQQLLNTRQPLGASLPQTVFVAQRAQADPLATLTSDLYFAPIGRQFSFAVEVPVEVDGQLRFYLSMGGAAGQIQDVLMQQQLPQGWVGAIMDRQGQVVARTSNIERHIGRKPPAEYLAQVERAPETIVTVPSLDGDDLIASFSRAPLHGWGSLLGVPESQVNSPLRTAALFGTVAALLLGAALWGAAWMGRRLVQPITALAGAAQALGRGEPVRLVPTGLSETDAVAAALTRASEDLRNANAGMEQRVQLAVAESDKAHRAMIQGQRLEAVGQLTGGVAHDFNNLLMVVNTNVHLLRARHPVLAQDAQLQRIERAVSTGSQLTRQLLAFARRQPLRPQAVDLATALPEVMGLIRPTLGAMVEAQCEVEPGTPCVEVDPAELELAVINLCVNARDAMPQGGRLNVRAGLAPGDTAQVCIAVEDTGDGIAPEVLARVFEPFFTTKEPGRGTGLGLSQVWGFASQAGGTAQIDSRPGAGTTVRLLLPASTLGEARPPTPLDAKALPPDCRVLLVEDNPELAQASRELLQQCGCAVVHVGDGASALEHLRNTAARPSVVLSDIRMPGPVDGIALAQAVRSQHPGLPVVLMTGYTGELDAARAAGLDVLAKPVPPRQLLSALAFALENGPTQRPGA